MTAFAHRNTARSAGAIAALAAFAIAAAVQPVHASRCPHHRSAATATAPHGSPATPVPHVPAETHGHGQESGEPHGPCTCLGACERIARVALPVPAFDATHPPHLPVVRLPAATDAPLPTLRPYTLPYANAPPRLA